ncbi:MAG: bifunctional UDP-sugar hydrolase/5'-nucleotidase [Hyphomicrobiaceae bacterium]
MTGRAGASVAAGTGVLHRALVAAMAALIAMAAGAVRCEAGERTVHMTFLLFSDIYEIAEAGGRGGFARVAGAAKAERASRPNVVVVDAGDTLSPSLLSGLDRGSAIVSLTNMVGVDIFVPGNHEFDFGEEVFHARMAEASFPLLAANMRDKDGRPVPGYADTRMMDIDGVKVGFIGLTDEDSAMRSSPGSLTFQPTVATGRAMAEKLRGEGADIVVAVAHSPWQTDLRLASSGVFDVVLSGHDHDLMLLYDGRTVLAEAKEEGQQMIAVDLAVTVRGEAEGRRQVSWWPRFRVIDTADVTPDPGVLARVEAYGQTLSKELDVVLGTTSTPLDSRKTLVRSEETAIGNLVTDALREALGADIAMMNGGGIRGDRIYEAGASLTRRDVLSELPFGNKTMLLEISGADLLEALETGVWFAGKPEGRFAQISGATIRVKRDALPGHRIAEATIGGRPLDPAATYRLAVIDFLARGKDGYQVLAHQKVLLDDTEGPLLANVVMAAIRKAGTVAPRVEGRIILE